ncbi:MAG TPA: iron transporter, partial [Actinobacteria bacterium]|nr:iron transporter [Actinomycetota bacterium]
MLANYLIGLREGLEAALVVGILVAYLTKIGQRARVGAVWTGVAAAVGLSVGVAAALAITSSELSATAGAAFAGIVSLLAVAGVTLMIFWMKRVSRTLAGELRSQVDTAIATGAGALVALA